VYYHGLHEMWNIADGPQKIILFYAKILTIFSKEKGKKTMRRARDFSWLSKYLLIMDFRFGAMLCCNLRNTNNFSDASHFECSREPHLAHGPQVPHACVSH